MRPREIGLKISRAVGCQVSWDEQVRGFYSVDASSYSLKPLVVTFPRSEQDIVKIVRIARRYKVSVTPRGAGTGLVGSALGEGIIVDMRHFDKIRLGRNYVTAGSGVFKGRLDKTLRKHGRLIGPDPSIGPFCTVGGMIGTNASGVHSLKYGSMVDNIMEVKMVDAFGDVVRLPGSHSSIVGIIPKNATKSLPKVSKNSCGYRIDKIVTKRDVHKIMAGSEGTLGIITSAKLRTYPMPKKAMLCIIQHRTVLEAAKDVTKIVKLRPSALELIDGNIAKHIKIKMPPRTGSLLFVEFDEATGHSRNQIQKIVAGRIIRIEYERDGIDRLWRFRNSALAYSLRSITKNETMPTLIEDAVVPVGRLPLFLRILGMLAKRHGMRMITYGHAGNGNLHIRPILKRRDISKITDIASEFFSAVIGIGGSITGEHGDGLARSEFVEQQYGRQTYSIFRKIKKQFDPENIMNPGKIISGSSTVTRNLKI